MKVTFEARSFGELAVQLEIALSELNPKVIGTAGDVIQLSPQDAVAKLATLQEHEDAPSGANVAGQLDKDGLPWDERIHSSSKKQTAKGVWSRRKNVDDAVFDQIAAQLKAANAGAVHAAPFTPPFTPPAPQPQQFQPPAAAPFQPPVQTQAPQPLPHIPLQIAPIPHTPQNQFADIPAYMAGAPAAAPAPVHQPAPVQPVAPQPAPQGQYQITDLFNKIQPMFAANLEQAQAYVNSLTQRLSTQFQMQVQSVNDIAGRPDMITYAMQLIAADGK